LFPNDQVDIYAGVDSEVGDFLNNARGAVNVDDSLVDTHLEAVPGLGTLTARRLTGGDLQDLGRDADGSLGLVALVLRAGNDLSACSLEGLGLSASEGHSIGEKGGLRSQLSYLILWISSWTSSPLIFSFSMSVIIALSISFLL